MKNLARDVAATLLLPALLLLLGACEHPLKPAQRIEEPRVLGARIVTEEGNASLEGGKSALVDVLVAGPQGPVDGRLAYELCLAAESQRGVPFCADPPFAQGTVTLGEVPLTVELPSSMAPGAPLAFRGVVCLEGEPTLGAEPLSWSCSGQGEPLRLSFDARLSDADFSNAAPDLAELQLTIGEVTVPRDVVLMAPTCDITAPTVAADTTHRLELELGAAAREDSEALQVSLFTTHGELEHHFRFVEPGEPLVVSLEWNSAEPGPVQQYVVVRDGRGGVSWASFSFCAR